MRFCSTAQSIPIIQYSESCVYNIIPPTACWPYAFVYFIVIVSYGPRPSSRRRHLSITSRHKHRDILQRIFFILLQVYIGTRYISLCNLSKINKNASVQSQCIKLRFDIIDSKIAKLFLDDFLRLGFPQPEKTEHFLVLVGIHCLNTLKCGQASKFRDLVMLEN